MSAEKVYNATRYSELPNTTPESFVLEGEKRAGVEDVWQTAHYLDTLLNVSDPSVLGKSETSRLLRGEQIISPPLVEQTRGSRFEAAGAILDEAIDRSKNAQYAANARWEEVRRQKRMAEQMEMILANTKLYETENELMSKKYNFIHKTLDMVKSFDIRKSFSNFVGLFTNLARKRVEVLE